MLSPAEMTRGQGATLRVIVRAWLGQVSTMVELDPPAEDVNDLLAALWVAWPVELAAEESAPIVLTNDLRPMP